MVTVIALIRLSLMVISTSIRPTKRVIHHDRLRDALCKYLMFSNSLLLFGIASLAIDLDRGNSSSRIDYNANGNTDTNQGSFG